MKQFTLTENHVTLLRAMHVGWQDAETGAPEIDPKRPYGNSSVARDIAELLGIIGKNDDLDLSRAGEDELLALHRETQWALQVVLSTGGFVPGLYEAPQYSTAFRRVVQP